MRRSPCQTMKLTSSQPLSPCRLLTELAFDEPLPEQRPVDPRASGADPNDPVALAILAEAVVDRADGQLETRSKIFRSKDVLSLWTFHNTSLVGSFVLAATVQKYILLLVFCPENPICY